MPTSWQEQPHFLAGLWHLSFKSRVLLLLQCSLTLCTTEKLPREQTQCFKQNFHIV